MGSQAIEQLKAQFETAWENLRRQLRDMEPYMERSDAPGEWTTRQVLSHLLEQEGWDPVAELKRFSTHDLPVIEIEAGSHFMTPERQRMTLPQFIAALDAQRRAIFDHLESLSESDLARKARIPLFKTFMGTDEIALPVYVGAMFDFHWNDHAGQLAKIRKAVGLRDAG